jgi:two-component system cell cycle sensor histidine kinase/response regulator CckA
LSDDLIPTSINDQIVNGEYILIEVIDNGVGMEREQISKIFDPFFSTKDLGAGTGLGLSTVYGIIKQTNGYIYVSTELGKGSNFSIFLRRCFDKIDDASLQKQDKLSSKSNIDLRGTSTILLVEDEEPVRIFSASALKSKGYNVLSPETVEEALSIIDEKGDKIDLVVSDVMMPGMNGPDMIKEAHKKYPDLKVVFVSGYGEDAFKETYGNDRHFNFLSKPYSLKQLAQKVKEVIDAD